MLSIQVFRCICWKNIDQCIDVELNKIVEWEIETLWWEWTVTNKHINVCTYFGIISLFFYDIKGHCKKWIIEYILFDRYVSEIENDNDGMTNESVKYRKMIMTRDILSMKCYFKLIFECGIVVVLCDYNKISDSKMFSDKFWMTTSGLREIKKFTHWYHYQQTQPPVNLFSISIWVYM